MLVPSTLISYNSAYSSNLGTPLGARHDIDMRNCVSAPVVVGRNTWPKLLALKQSNKLSGALGKLPDWLVGELQPVLPTGFPSA
jgi:hypothetical protein